MKKIIFTIILSLLYFTQDIKSQGTTFDFLLSSSLDESFWDIIETSDNNIYFTGDLSSVQHPYKDYGLIVKLDKYGNLIDSIVVYSPDKSMQITRILPSINHEFVLVTSIYDTIGTFKSIGIGLNMMDDNLNLYNQSYSMFPSTYRFGHLSASIESTGNILVGGSVSIQGSVPRPYFYEFNSDFDSLKAKFYLDDLGMISNLKTLDNGSYWMLNMISNQYEILDSELNIVSVQKVPNTLTSNYGVVWDTDTSFYLLGDGLQQSPIHNLGFIRQFHPMDTTGHIYNHWRVSDTVDFPAFWGGIDFKNKDSIFIGGTRDFWGSYYSRWPSWFIVLQTDSLLNIRWERFYGGDAFYTMGKLIATNDGGCIVAGTRYDYMNTTELETDIIVLKLNGDGLITSNQGKPSIEMHEAIVYPNPGNKEILVRIAVQYKHSVFDLFDINGRHILKQNFTGTQGTVNTTFLDNGTYIYRITSNDGLFETGKWIKQ